MRRDLELANEMSVRVARQVVHFVAFVLDCAMFVAVLVIRLLFGPKEEGRAFSVPCFPGIFRPFVRQADPTLARHDFVNYGSRRIVFDDCEVGAVLPTSRLRIVPFLRHLVVLVTKSIGFSFISENALHMLHVSVEIHKEVACNAERYCCQDADDYQRYDENGDF